MGKPSIGLEAHREASRLLRWAYSRLLIEIRSNPNVDPIRLDVAADIVERMGDNDLSYSCGPSPIVVGHSDPDSFRVEL